MAIRCWCFQLLSSFYKIEKKRPACKILRAGINKRAEFLPGRVIEETSELRQLNYYVHKRSKIYI